MTVECVASSDLTLLFKSCVKTIRTRNKAIGVTLPQTKILPNSPTPFSQFFSRAKDLTSNIVSHRNLLRDHKAKYLQDQQQSMSDYERSYMEKVVSTNLRIIDDNLRTLGTELSDNQPKTKDASESQEMIMTILRMSFQEINNTFKQMKELRKKKQKEKDNLYRLHRPGGVRKRVSSSGSDSSPLLTQTGKKSESSDNIQSSQSDDHSTSLMETLLGELSEEERQVLEQENDHLYRELMSNHEEVRQITRQVVELGQMQDLLSENVDLQAHQIEEIQETIIASTENIRGGNEQVREAMRKDAGFRVWIMFFLIVMSCTILFLDWYNS